MQIIGLGTDIVEVKRIEILAQKPGALSRLFTQHELDYSSLARKNKYEHLAARFAAKEAVFKALPFAEIAFKNIQVSNLENGCPQVTVADERARDLVILISLTHTKEYALATAVVQK